MIYKHNSGFNQPTMWIRKMWTWRDVLAAGLKPHLQFCSSSDLSRRVFFAPDIARLCPSSAYLKQSSSKQKWWCCARLAVAPGWLWGRRSALLWISETRAKNSRLSSSPRLFWKRQQKGENYSTIMGMIEIFAASITINMGQGNKHPLLIHLSLEPRI